MVLAYEGTKNVVIMSWVVKSDRVRKLMTLFDSVKLSSELKGDYDMARL